MRVYVICDNEAAFHDWCRQMGVHPGAAVFVDSPEKLEEIRPEDALVDLTGGPAAPPIPRYRAA